MSLPPHHINHLVHEPFACIQVRRFTMTRTTGSVPDWRRRMRPSAPGFQPSLATSAWTASSSWASFLSLPARSWCTDRYQPLMPIAAFSGSAFSPAPLPSPLRMGYRPCGCVLAEDMVLTVHRPGSCRCLPCSLHVLVTHSRLFIGNAFSFKCLVKPEIGHDGGDHGVIEQVPAPSCTCRRCT